MNEIYKLKFVNNGKEFVMPDWTVEKHELLLEQMIEYDEKVKLKVMTQKEYDKKYRVTMVLISLHEIDKNVTEKDLAKLHPDNFVDLWLSVYNSGKVEIRVKESDFHEGEQSPK